MTTDDLLIAYAALGVLTDLVRYTVNDDLTVQFITLCSVAAWELFTALNSHVNVHYLSLVIKREIVRRYRTSRPGQLQVKPSELCVCETEHAQIIAQPELTPVKSIPARRTLSS